jgi:ABC-2 type transport system ATP-binding protein
MLELSRLRKSYGDLVAVKDLSLEINRGEVFGFLGPNGAGKTTAINMVCGLLKSDSGTITVNGLALSDNYLKCKKMMGHCPQDLVIWDSLTCFEQLEFMGEMYDVSRGQARRKAGELLEIFGLEDKRNKLAKTLSGGMKRRLNIALGLVHDPEILILDEPQAGLDPQSRLLVREYILSLGKEKTVIVTTHDMDEADRLSDRIAIIDYGQLLVLDTPDNLKIQIGEGDVLEIKVPDGQEEMISRLKLELPVTFSHLAYQQGILRLVGTDIQNALVSLLDIFSQSQVKIEDMTIRKKTLEDVFIALTGRRLRE